MCNAKPFIINLLFSLTFFILVLGCNERNQPAQIADIPENLYASFDKINHLQPVIDKKQFDTSHKWEFGWNLLKPIDLAPNNEIEKHLSRRLSPGQKALYFFWYLDAEVTNGGFIQFYWNDYRIYLPPINEGLKLIRDSAMLQLIDKADREYIKNQSAFKKQKLKDNWSPLYENLKQFDEYDSTYYIIHDRTMDLIEKYARLHPEEFAKLK